MAILVGPWQRAIDDDLLIVPGALLYVYDEGTLTLASDIYSNAALSVAHANPLTADDAGWFDLIFAQAGQKYDMSLKTAGGVEIIAFLSQEALGSDTGAWLRDFTNSRGRIFGTGGEVSYEGGPPTGDDIGGAVRLGGYEDTQAETAEIDAALTNTTGTLTENSKKLIGIVNTAATAFTAVSSVDIALTQNPTGVLAWDVDIFDLITSAASSVQARFSYDDGLTFKAGAADYAYAYQYKNLGDAAVYPTFANSAGAAQMVLQASVDQTTKRGWLTLRILTVASGTKATLLKGEAMAMQGAGTALPDLNLCRGFGLGGYGKATHIRILFSSGTGTGLYRVAPLRGFGE